MESGRHEHRGFARLSRFTEAGKRAVGRSVGATAFVAGIASFFYGLAQSERTRWFWVLGGIAVVAIFGKVSVGLAKQMSVRYRKYPRVLELLGQAQADGETLQARLNITIGEIRGAWHAGLDEGRSQIMGCLTSDGVPIRPRLFDVVKGVVCISAEPTTQSDQVIVRARYSLVHVDTRRVLAIFTVSDVSNGVCVLKVVSDSADEAWERVTSTAVAGAQVPPGLALRPSTLDDYNELPDSAAQVDGQGDS